MFADLACKLIDSLRGTGVNIVNPRTHTKQFNTNEFIKCCDTVSKKEYGQHPQTYLHHVFSYLWQMQNIAADADSVRVALKQGILYPLESKLIENRLYYVSLVDPDLHLGVDGAAVIVCRMRSMIHLTVYMWPTNQDNIKPHFRYRTISATDTDLAIFNLFGNTKHVLHDGYERQWLKMRDLVTTGILSCVHKLSEYHPKSKFHLTSCGVSRGGTLATSFALHMSRLTLWPIDLFCFSSVRMVTSWQMQQICDSSIRQCIRLYNRSDPCTHIPLKKSGYYHIDEYITDKKLTNVFPNHVGVDLEDAVSEPVKTMVRKSPLLSRIIFWHLAYYLPFDGERRFISHICSLI